MNAEGCGEFQKVKSYREYLQIQSAYISDLPLNDKCAEQTQQFRFKENN